MSYRDLPLISDTDLATARRELGSALPRILGYYRQDGVTSIHAIENAMQARSATALVLPAHSLKGESRQLGAERVAELSQYLEMTARRCIEDRTELPDALAEDVRGLRSLFHETMTVLERTIGTGEAPPAARAPVAPSPPASIARPRPAGVAPQRPVFGRRAV
ncbi:Hpt domain-containing protein [Sphingobium sufflavum]|uniref:Hpt domain-containing protein n=1 Tax=Sphingobium sufflavum TaxID=1129547 RepID=UPI001F308751|nr:Hpt domain-containing protein [Sphingobium sufflavum]MCE7797927.1 Hpt domain-containing protein [Sphingobium sufflavum]